MQAVTLLALRLLLMGYIKFAQDECCRKAEPTVDFLMRYASLHIPDSYAYKGYKSSLGDNCSAKCTKTPKATWQKTQLVFDEKYQKKEKGSIANASPQA